MNEGKKLVITRDEAAVGGTHPTLFALPGGSSSIGFDSTSHLLPECVEPTPFVSWLGALIRSQIAKQVLSGVAAAPSTMASRRAFSAATGGSSSVLNKYSRTITEPASQGASQAMLYAAGLSTADMKKPQIGASRGVMTRGDLPPF